MRINRPLSNKQNGFTLIEILIAVFIVAIISVIMLRGLQSAITTKNHLERNSIRLEKLQFAFSLLNSDVQNMVNQSIIASDGTQMAPAFLHADNSHMFEFTRSGVSNPLGEARTTLLRVGYSWEDGQLKRTVWNTLNRTSNTQLYTRVLLDKVSNLQWQFLGSTTNFSANNWLQTWPVAALVNTMPLPQAVQLTLTIEGWGEVSRIFVVNAQTPQNSQNPPGMQNP